METLISWQEKYSVHVQEIDDQHKKLIDMINELFDAFMRKDQEDAIEKILHDMAAYSVDHFYTEEKYFARFGYNDSERHIAEHRKFTVEVENLQNEYKRNSYMLTSKLMAFLRDWLNHHILEVDKKYIDCFTAAGLK